MEQVCMSATFPLCCGHSKQEKLRSVVLCGLSSGDLYTRFSSSVNVKKKVIIMENLEHMQR